MVSALPCVEGVANRDQQAAVDVDNLVDKPPSILDTNHDQGWIGVGAYARVRHRFYAGFVLIAIALLIIVGSLMPAWQLAWMLSSGIPFI